MPQSQDMAAVFDTTADIYRKMIAHNYLNQAEVYACLHERLVRRAPFRFLDVACWTASCSAEALAGTRVVAYHGIDVVEWALVEARAILASKLSCPVHLVAADYVPALAQWAEPVDIVWIGLSLHHQQTEGKRAVMRDIFRILSGDGSLLIYENTSPDGEYRDGWQARWDLQREEWREYTLLEWDTMRTHVSTCDFPETLASWRDLGQSAGFASVEEVYCCPTDLFRMFEFRKTAT